MHNDSLKNGRLNTVIVILLIALTLSLVFSIVHAIPVGPTVTAVGNATKGITPSTKVNSSINGTITPGGYIFYTNLNTLQQNIRWKAYVGNVTGTLTLDDANDYSIFQWPLTTVAGEVYATRASSNVNWTGINCTWIWEGSRAAASSNRSAEEAENAAMNHNTPDDNITATFTVTNHSELTIGAQVIGKNQCWSLTTFQDDQSQSFDDSDNANYTQIILYDGAFNKSDGNIVYVTPMEEDNTGFDNQSYDFQMILPEDGSTGYSSSTAYYFYVELT